MCVRKFPSCCNPCLPRQPRSLHNVSRTPPRYPAHPDVRLDIREHTRAPSPLRGMDLRPSLQRCVPSAHPAQCPPSEKMSNARRSPTLPTLPPAPLSRLLPVPTSPPTRAESETSFDIRESRPIQKSTECAIANSPPRSAAIDLFPAPRSR